MISPESASPGPFFDVLDAEDDEVVIVSLLLDRQTEGRVILRHGAALIAPPECGQVAWGVWASQQTKKIMATCPETAPAAFIHDAGEWIGARAVLSLDQAREWVAPLSTAHPIAPTVWPAAYGLPAFEALVSKPDVLIRVLPGTDTPAGSFLVSAKRPALGTIWQSENRDELLIPDLIEHEGEWVGPELCLLGILVPSVGVPQAVPPPFGLFVGRLERQAWLIELAGDGPAFR